MHASVVSLKTAVPWWLEINVNILFIILILTDKEKKKKESIFDLSKYIDKTIRVKFQGGREASGVLKGFDPLLNLVLDGTIEYMRDPDDQYKLTEDTRQLGLVVCRGTSVVLICPQDGMEAIPNPFVQQQEGEIVVVTGGHFLDEVVWYSVDWVRVFQSARGNWVDGPSMQKSRHNHCSVGLGYELFVLGGSMDEGPIADVERLMLGAESWVNVSPMVRAVERAAVVAMGSCIYIACGLDENGEVYSGIQRYQVQTDQWDVVSYSPLPRYDLLATKLNGALYLFGGQALRLDVTTDEWTVIEEVCLEKKFFTGCSTANGQVYLVGERKGNKTLPNMVLLDPYTDTCIEMDNSIPCPLPVRGCVTIRVTS
ncbi:U6 snRNA-associated Sm-like protein LSm7 isoform X4 [Anguilla rostrata]|uniref:U6 snRNA-associated Sm-like protein LSm7 isoform X2 n=1 Tax=Anguilla anguilla TaxID=7936 RepID=UPI0015AAF231|nr:U6 snRNA-associated Sm-like protein LSm7 isoform X2 [Anguilla anguilla]